MTSVTATVENREWLLACYRSGQISEPEWTRHLQDPDFSAWVTDKNLERATMADERDRILTADDVRERLRQACAAAGGRNKWAMENNTTRSYVSLVLTGGFPGPLITNALGLRKNITWSPKSDEKPLDMRE